MEITAHFLFGSPNINAQPIKVKLNKSHLSIRLPNRRTNLFSIQRNKILSLEENTRKQIEVVLTSRQQPVEGLLESTNDIHWDERYVVIKWDGNEETRLAILAFRGHAASTSASDLLTWAETSKLVRA